MLGYVLVLISQEGWAVRLPLVPLPKMIQVRMKEAEIRESWREWFQSLSVCRDGLAGPPELVASLSCQPCVSALPTGEHRRRH